MTVFVNGKFVSEDQAFISVFDRGLMYGDGCFETLRVYNGKPAFWRLHIERLTVTLKGLSIPFEVDSNHLAQTSKRLVEENNLPEAVLRWQVTRGRGQRGYSIKGADQPSLIASLHPLPPGIDELPRSLKIRTSTTRIDAQSPLIRHKSSNKLLQILGKAEADQYQVDDVLFLTHEGHASETSNSNLFWVDGKRIFTPPLSAGVLPGITRQIVIKICQSNAIPIEEKLVTIQELRDQKALFLTQSVGEVTAVSSLDSTQCPCSPVVKLLRDEYRQRALASEFPGDQLISAT